MTFKRGITIKLLQMHKGTFKRHYHLLKQNSYHMLYTEYTSGYYLCRTSGGMKPYTEVIKSRHLCGFWCNTTFRNHYNVSHTYSSSWRWIFYAAIFFFVQTLLRIYLFTYVENKDRVTSVVYMFTDVGLFLVSHHFACYKNFHK